MDHFSFASSITFASGSSAASNPSKTTQLNYEFNDKAPKICYHNDIKRFFRNDLKGVHNKMTKFVNPDNLAFQTSLNAQIYVDKSELIEYTNSVCHQLMPIFVIAAHAALENQLRQTCLLPITAKAVIPKRCFLT